MLATKIGMTQIFQPNGRVVPVTVVQAGPCTVTQVKTAAQDGYEAAQVGFGATKQVNKPKRGHIGRGASFRYLREISVDSVEEIDVGQQFTAGDLFEAGEKVDVIGRSKGKGFQGTMKRHGFGGGPRTHGQSDRARAPGSIGATTYPARVLKGKKMAGHMGDARVTVKGIEIVQVDAERNLLLLKGGLPGAPNSLLMIRKAK
jgi:large subunit ribosomal protein L3